MATSTRRKFTRNILSNTATYGMNIVVAFLLSPFVVHALGDVLYGFWTLVISLTGYCGLLDLGVRSAVGQYVTRYWAKEDMEGVNKTLNTAMILLAGIAGIAVIATGILAWMLPRWIGGGGPEVVQAQWAMVISGVGVSLGLPLAIFSTVTYARQRFDIESGIGISAQITRALLTVAALKLGFGIMGIVVVVTGMNLSASVVRLIVARKLMPRLRFAPALFNRASVRELGSYGFFNFLINAAERIVLYTDAVVIGTVLGATALTYYAIGGNLIPYFLSMISAITWTITPYATSCDARGERDKLVQALLVGTRGTLFLASVIAGGLLLMGKDFLALWMGAKYVASGGSYTSSAVILTVLTWAGLVRASQSCGMQVLFGMRKERFLASIAAGEAIANLILSVILVHCVGAIGVAFGTLIPVAVLRGGLQSRFLVRLLAIPRRRYFVMLFRACVPVMISMWLMTLGVRAWNLQADSWPRFLLKGAVLAAPVPLVGLFVAMTRDERRDLLRRIFKRGLESAA